MPFNRKGVTAIVINVKNYLLHFALLIFLEIVVLQNHTPLRERGVYESVSWSGDLTPSYP